MARTDWFVHDRFGMFIHFGLSAIRAEDLSWPMSWKCVSTREWREHLPYFNPDKAGPREWVRMAREAGCRYAVMIAKHHEGFCLWDSKLTEYTSVKAPRCRRDLVREFVDACAEAGIRPGLYYSLIDWDHPDYPADKLHPQRNDPVERDRPRDWNRYVEYMHAQVRELLTHYGKLHLLWLDFSYDDMSGEKWRAEAFMKMVRELQPEILVDNRLVAGHEDPAKPAQYGDFATPEQAVPYEGMRSPDGKPVVWEACMTLGSAWGYSRDDRHFVEPGHAVKLLVECVAKGGNLLLNTGPNARGIVRAEEAEAFAAVGRWMELHAESIYGASQAIVDGQLLPKPVWGWYTRRDNVVYAHLLERPLGPLPLPGLGGKVAHAFFLHDGSAVSMRRGFNAIRDDSFEVLDFIQKSLPMEPVTVVALHLKPGH